MDVRWSAAIKLVRLAPPRKWLVHPDSVMAQVSQAGRVSGTTTLIPEMEVKENFL